MSILNRFIQIWMAWIMSRPRFILAVAVASALVCLTFTFLKLEVQSDQLELISTDHPLIALSEKSAPFNLDRRTSFTVVVNPPSPARGIDFAKILSERVRQDPEFSYEVIDRVDPALFKRWALLYLDKAELTRMAETFHEHERFVRAVAEKPELVTLLEELNREMATRMVSELFTGFLDEKPVSDAQSPPGAMDLGFLVRVLEGISGALEGRKIQTSPWDTFFSTDSLDLEHEGWFWEGNRKSLLLFVQPQGAQDDIGRQRESLERLRAHIREVCAAFPDVQAGVTGEDALNIDEMSTALGDISKATWMSLLGILALMTSFFRGLRRPLTEMVSLAVGLCWTFGWTTLFIGHLNMLTIVFAPLLCGLGVDYGIHWFARFEEEERSSNGDRPSLIIRITERAGPGIIIAGLSTAFSFLPFVFTGFRALVELGLITGMGIILTLLADMSVLPALSLHTAGKSTRKSIDESGSGDRTIIRFSLRSARLVLASIGVVSLLSLFSASSVRFDINPLRLQSENAEAVIWEKRLLENADRSLLSASALAQSQEEVLAKARAFRALDTVAEVQTIFSVMPSDQEEKIPILHSVARAIPEERQPGGAGDDLAVLRGLLERIRFKMQVDRAMELGAEGKIAEEMARVRALAEEIISRLGNMDADTELRLAAYREHFRSDLKEKLSFIREASSASPMEVQDVPSVIGQRFYHEGTYMLRIYPRESIWEEGALARFIRSIQEVDPNVVGDPVSLHVFAAAYKEACIRASIYSLAAILLLLLLTLRNLPHALLALAPLAVGSLWTVGIMGLVDLDFNLANSIFMPLIVGAGVEYGVIILHRWREGREPPGHLPFSTGKGIILAALTTTIGFGTLMISHHRGIFSLGFVAFTGSLCVLLAALIFLPAALTIMRPPARSFIKGDITQ